MDRFCSTSGSWASEILNLIVILSMSLLPFTSSSQYGGLLKIVTGTLKLFFNI